MRSTQRLKEDQKGWRRGFWPEGRARTGQHGASMKSGWKVRGSSRGDCWGLRWKLAALMRKGGSAGSGSATPLQPAPEMPSTASFLPGSPSGHAGGPVWALLLS